MKVEEEGVELSTLCEIDELSELEKDIILVLGDDIYNILVKRISIQNAELKSFMFTYKLLHEACGYDNNQILHGLALLYLKDIIRIAHIPKQIDGYEKRYNNTPHPVIYTYKTKSELIELIINKTFLLNDDVYYLGTQDEIKQSIMPLLNTNDLEDINVSEIYNVAAEYIKNKVMGLVDYIFLTNYDQGISGTKLYQYLNIKQIDEKIESLKILKENLEIELPKKFNEIQKEAEDKIELGVKGSLNRNIEIITIFIAAITLIIGNVSFIPQIQGTTIIDIARLIMILNGCLLAAVSTLVILISKVVTPSGKSKVSWIAIIFSILLLTLGIILPWIIRLLQL